MKVECCVFEEAVIGEWMDWRVARFAKCFRMTTRAIKPGSLT